MATASKNDPQQSNVQGQQGQGQGQGQNVQGGANVGSPISNEAYDIISALQSKLEGLEAYRKYAQDGMPQLWQQLTQIEVQAVGKLVDELERLVRDGKFRMQQPGQAH